MTYQAFDSTPVLSNRRIGTSFILLALFAGLLGGSLALPFLQTHPTAGLAFCHGILMAFFVICPAALGGFGQWLLPAELGTDRTTLPAFSLAGFGFLSSGVVLLPLQPLLALALWAVGVLALAVDIITTFLEGRTRLFRKLSPLAWSMLATASGVTIVAPTLAAVVTHMLINDAPDSAAQDLIGMLHLPETALMLTPALGLVCHLLMPRPDTNGFSGRVAPYVFGCMAVLGPLCWMDSLFGGMSGLSQSSLVALTQFLPSFVLVATLCVDVWKQKRALDGTTLWALGSLVLFSAGWIAEFMPGHALDHTAAAFGGVMALCGGFYAWMMRLLPDHIPAPLSRLHAGLTFVGALCSLTPVLMPVGEGLMGLSLLTFGLLGLFLIRETGRARVRA
ncbi:cbb3-type cytochrome c oxidase subunit I [Gluconobacter japonicus]|uniref:cbb3-type cytochrome c oxidase subunit I n=1 Tax=Gluconobacter japonicus TaxID=376620 RepID=UPI0024ADA524|nr:cbb3-type cytochrome c oxidase subunit I [Gluconobacter japonicus]MDI6651758.1 cbb3-type cytochrome c oxidase subunit I [Gluconobacter japonicus]